jgi:toxin ParE1/3/4
MKIRWSPTAVTDLKSIRDYIAKDSPAAARNVANQIKVSVNRLVEFPLSDRMGRVTGTRELVIPGTCYIATYIIQGNEVQIAAILHGKQLWPDFFRGQTKTCLSNAPSSLFASASNRFGLLTIVKPALKR